MSINKKCLAALQNLGLPMHVSVLDRSGVKITEARIDPNGSITDLQTGQSYASPSGLRAHLIEPNGPTYMRLLYKEKSLRDWGVHP